MLRLLYPHANEFNDPQEPEKSCNMAPAELSSVPIPLKAMFIFEDVAVNLYHTSSSGVPLSQPEGMLLLAVAAQIVPDVALPIVSVVAPLQSSLEGGSTGATYDTHMLKVHLLLGVDVGVALVKTLK